MTGGATESAPALETRAAALPPPKPRMPLILTLTAPGLGHLRYGEPGAGSIGLAITILLSVELVAVTIWPLVMLVSGRPFLVPILAWIGLFAAGLAYTGLLAVDSLRLSETPPRAPDFVRFAGLSGGAFVSLLAAAVLVRASLDVLPLLSAGVIG